jgi:Mn2+/Fe2+ NRAMP family transporter
MEDRPPTTQPPTPNGKDASGGKTSKSSLADVQDLARAEGPHPGVEPDKPWWRSIGPGLITGAADDDPSGIGTYSVVGAQFGYLLLWLVPFCLPLMIAVQEMCGRIGVVTGKGLASAIKENYPRWVLYGSLLLLIGANITNIYADLNVMAASAQMLFKGTFYFWLALMTEVMILMQVLIPYRLYVRWLKWLCLAMLGYAVTAFMPGAHNDWGAIARHLFVPSWSNNPTFILTIVGFLGTTISPYLFFWQAGEEVEEEIESGKADAPGHRISPAANSEIRNLRGDTIIGMVASQAVTFFILICTAAQDAARALLPLGKSAYWLFALGILGTGSLAIPTLAGSIGYAVAEAYGLPYGLYRRFTRARGFYLVITGSILAGYAMNFMQTFSPVKTLLYSAVINGVFAPPLIVILLLVCNNRKIFGDRCNGRLSNVLGWATVAFMGIAAGVMIWSILAGKSS